MKHTHCFISRLLLSRELREGLSKEREIMNNGPSISIGLGARNLRYMVGKMGHVLESDGGLYSCVSGIAIG